MGAWRIRNSSTDGGLNPEVKQLLRKNSVSINLAFRDDMTYKGHFLNSDILKQSTTGGLNG
jgi:hypothetical protein